MNNELYHHGILGQKWGVRRFQRNDGTLTDAGKKRYNKSTSEFVKQVKSELKKKGKIVAGAAVSAGGSIVGRAIAGGGTALVHLSDLRSGDPVRIALARSEIRLSSFAGSLAGAVTAGRLWTQYFLNKG